MFVFSHLFFSSNEVTSLILALMDVGGNVLQAASKTVTKDQSNDPGAVIEVIINLSK